MRTGTSSRSACARSGGRAGSPSAEPCGLQGAGLPLSTRPLCGTLSPHNAFGALPSSPRPPPAGVGPGHAVRGPRAQSPFPGPRRQRPSRHRSGLGPCFRPARDAESCARARAPPAQCRSPAPSDLCPGGLRSAVPGPVPGSPARLPLLTPHPPLPPSPPKPHVTRGLVSGSALGEGQFPVAAVTSAATWWPEGQRPLVPRFGRVWHQGRGAGTVTSAGLSPLQGVAGASAPASCVLRWRPRPPGLRAGRPPAASR